MRSMVGGDGSRPAASVPLRLCVTYSRPLHRTTRNPAHRAIARSPLPVPGRERPRGPLAIP
jgi:hypothetical protein